MRLKKINAALGLLSIVAMLAHVGYTDYAYLAFYYNPALKQITSLPFMVTTCLHAVLGMAAVFLQSDGTRLDLYPRQNAGTIIQRLSAALILPLLFLHIRTYDLLSASAEGGRWLVFALLMLNQPLFYADVIAHSALSLSRGLITLGWLSSRKAQKRLDRIAIAVGAALFTLTVFAVVKGELAMFVK